MYNEEYETEQDVKTSDSFLVNFYYNNKVLIWILIGVVAFILIMSLLTKGGSSSSTTGGYDVTIISNDEKVVISLGHTYTLKAQVKNNSNARVTWSSSDENVATVNSDSGTVTAVGYGTAKIYATYIHTDNTKYTSDPPKEVTVADGNPSIQLTDVSFQTGSLLMPLNSKYQIRLSLTPSNGYVTSKSFTSSNTNVVTVDNDGVVTSVGEGEATISLNVNSGAIRKELKVYVNKEYTRSEIIVSPDTISFDGELVKMKIGSSEKLKYSLSPNDANSSRLVWSSSKEEIATVDQNGLVRALKSGRTTITLKSVTGVYDTIDVEVEESIVEVTDISLSSTSLYLNVGETGTIIPTVSPANASNKSLSYISGNSSIAAVAPNQTGTSATIHAISAGTTTITVISNNNIEKRITVTVASSNSGNNGGSSSGGSSSGGSSSNASNQGFTISSKDANWATTHEGFIVTSESATVNNAATPPVEITVTKTNSSIARIRVAVCPVSVSTCDPSSSTYLKLNITGTTGSFTVSSSGTYKIAVGKYNSSGSLIGTTYKYIAIGTGSGSSSGGSGSTGTDTVVDLSSISLVLSNNTGTISFTEKANVKGTFTNSINNTFCVNFNGSYGTVSNPTANVAHTVVLKGQGRACTASITVKFTPTDSTYNTITKTVQVAVGSSSGGGSGTKIYISTVSYTCKDGKVTFSDSGRTLTSSDYSCTMTGSDGLNNSYYCVGKGNYTGDVTRKCPVAKKSLSSLSRQCSGGNLLIKDGTISLRWQDYCTRDYRSSANYDRYVYTCTGKGNYNGSFIQSCSF